MAKMTSEMKQLTDALLSLIPDAPRGPTPEAKATKAKQHALKKATFKSKRFAYYIVGREGAYLQGKSYEAGDVIKIPLEAPYDGMPSKTFLPATEASIAEADKAARFAAAEEEALAGAAEDDDALDPDELAADRATAASAEGDDDEGEAEEPEDEEPEAKPTPPPPPAKPARAKGKPAKPAPKKGTAGKRSSRASDQDVA